MYIPTIEDVSNLKSVLDLAAQVYRYLTQPTRHRNWENRKGAEKAAILDAVTVTLGEWAQVVESVQSVNLENVPFRDRGRVIGEIADQYEVQSGSGKLPSIPLTHTRLEKWPEGTILVHFGESRQTEALRGQVLVLSRDLLDQSLPIGDNMALPTFKVTMLGDSGSGKTVFMSSMYALLREGRRGIAIKALNDSVDLELGDIMERLYLHNAWPPGTDLAQKKYDFELLVDGTPVAKIDWVDYRGGALLEEPESDGGKALAKRLRESHSIIWMVDMTKLTSERVDGVKERIQTRVSRMAAICRQAVQSADESRAWIFVRTKSDTVRGRDGNPDWQKACSELVQHLGPVIDIATSGKNSRAAVLPISSVGRVRQEGDIKEQPVGDDPSFVEWPLLLSLAFLARSGMDRLSADHCRAEEERVSRRLGSVETFVREFLNLGPSEYEREAMQKLDEMSRQLVGIRFTINKLLQGCPSVVRLLADN